MKDILDIDKIKALLNEFANLRDWNKFHNPKNISMAIACETGELLEIFQWLTDMDSINVKSDAIIKKNISHEIADIMLYLIRLSGVLEINISEAIIEKVAINNAKYPSSVVKGSAKKYTEYSS